LNRSTAAVYWSSVQGLLPSLVSPSKAVKARFRSAFMSAMSAGIFGPSPFLA